MAEPPKKIEPFSSGATVRDVVDVVKITNASAPLSAVGTTDPTRLWVTIQASGGDAMLYEVTDLAGTPATTPHVIGKNYPAGGSLATTDTGLVVALGADSVVHYALDGKLTTLASYKGKNASSGDASLARIGSKLLVAWDGNNEAMEYAWIDGTKLVGPKELPGDGMFPSATAAFGGAVVWADDKGLQILKLGAGATTAEVLSKDQHASPRAVGDAEHAWIVKVPSGGGSFLAPKQVSLLTVTAAGQVVEPLGQMSGLGEHAIAKTDGGLLIVWTGPRSEVHLAVATLDGKRVGDDLIVTPGEERGRHPTVAWVDGNAYVLWNQMGAPTIRMARVTVR